MKKLDENKLIILEDYINKVIQLNHERDEQDIRLKFFYNKKLQQILLLKKVNTCAQRYDVSRTFIHTLDSPFEYTDFENKKEFKQHILDNLDVIFYNPEPIAELVDSNGIYYPREEKTCYLERFEVDKEYRNLGLGRKLINTLKSSCFNNSQKTIKGQIIPIDTEAHALYSQEKSTPIINQIINHIAKKTGLFKNSSFTDITHLKEIYKHLGFQVNESTRDLKLSVNPLTITLDNKLPKSFTSFDKNPDTLILF